MTKAQIGVIIGAILLVFGLYFGMETKPPKQKLVEKSRANSIEKTSVQNLLRDAKQALSLTDRQYLNSLESVAASSQTDSSRSSVYKQLSSRWFQLGKPAIAGHFAERVAEIEGTEESWSIAGTTFAYALTSNAEAKVKDYSMDRARQCFENAMSINPENIQHRLNLAICYAEYPPAENPMKGIQLLLELNRNYPEEPTVLLQLGRFGLQTGQYEKAAARLKKALQLDPESRSAACLLVEALTGMGKMDEAEEYAKQCD